MAITRVEAATILVSAIATNRINPTIELRARAWSGSGSDLERLVRVYITEDVRKTETRHGIKVDVIQARDVGHVEIGKDGRVWLSAIRRKHGKVASLVKKAIGGVEVDTNDGSKALEVVVVKRGMGRGE